MYRRDQGPARGLFGLAVVSFENHARRKVGANVKCPACESLISADGATVEQRSPYLADLEETGETVVKLAAKIDQLEKALALQREKKTTRRKVPSRPALPAEPKPAKIVPVKLPPAEPVKLPEKKSPSFVL